ncbi:MAG: antibiotic biosynthesis monooxygenase [Actinomycetia bacterium]|nr:antibiotic biosynthesis monooxygenase [Actinomycetes bacterium]
MSNNTSTRSTQVVAYEIQPERLSEFLEIKDKLITEARTLPGLIESATFRSDEQNNLFFDRMIWESARAAKEAMPIFEKLPTTPAFMGLMAGPPRLAGQFTLIAGN